VSVWDKFIAWLNAEEPPQKTAAPPSTTIDPDTERYLHEVEAKLDRTVQDLADGLVNRAQFENLYRHYQNQRRMLRYAAKVLAYAIYDNESSVPLYTRGNFPVDNDLVVGFLSGFRSAAVEILGAGAAKAEAEDGKVLCYLPGQHSTLIVLYSSDPAEIDMRSLRQTHLHFETLNGHLLKQRPIPTDELLFNYDMVLKLSRQEDRPPSSQAGQDTGRPG